MSRNGEQQMQTAANITCQHMGGIPSNVASQQEHSAPARGAHDHPNLLYDLSSFDPLQAHAFQLTASAGLANLVPPPSSASAPSEASSQQPQHVQNLAIHQHPYGLPQLAPQGLQIQQGNPQQPSYYFIQPQAGITSTLQPIAPSSQQGSVPQTASQSYILPTTAQRSQQHLHPSMLAAGSPSAGALPGILMSQHLQSVVANVAQHPAPLAPAIPSAHKRVGLGHGDTDGQPASKKAREMAPSVVSSSTNSALHGSLNCKDEDKPPQEASQSELDKMTPAERRRYERNLREQQRSYKISLQIKELRDVLSESNVPFKPNKYSILLSVVDYIKQLQARAIMLDAEHQKLITTIRETNEMVNSGTAPSSADEMDTLNGMSDNGNDDEMLFVQGLDYRSVFAQCPAALGIAALDGRILECNPEFQLLLGFPRDDLLKQSLFNLVRNHQDIFRAMAEMLKGAEVPMATGSSSNGDLKVKYWSGEVVSKLNAKLVINLTLTMADDGTPKFFNCALTSS